MYVLKDSPVFNANSVDPDQNYCHRMIWVFTVSNYPFEGFLTKKGLSSVFSQDPSQKSGVKSPRKRYKQVNTWRELKDPLLTAKLI